MLHVRQAVPSPTMKKEADPFFRDLWTGLVSELAWTNMNMDVIETDTEYQIHADLPGVLEEDVDINIENDILTLKAERKQKHNQSKDTEHRLERKYGPVQRSIKLPRDVDQTQVNASMEHGVLTIVIPKAENSHRCVKIPVTKKSA